MHQSVSSHVLAADRRFFAWWSWLAAATVIAGFSSSYYLWPLTRATRHAGGQPIAASLPFIVHAHALLFSAWLVVLVLQSGLVVSGRVVTHRRLGRAAALILPMMLATGLATAVTGGRDGWNPGGPYRDALGFMFVGITDLGVFFSLTCAGLALRHHPDLHRRLMLMGTLGGLLWPAITRLPLVAGRPPAMFALLTILVLAPAGRDLLRRSRVWWVSLGTGVAILASFPLRVAIGNSEAWRRVATWLIQ